MRLIDTKTGEFVEFFDLAKIPPYAILSHTWESAPPGEQPYQEVIRIQEKYRLLVRDSSPWVLYPKASSSPSVRSRWRSHF